ncbi:hypothetical protein [Mesorhizobium sp. NZP2234]|uniref:hypothetical protein n=1 Tax=Mesorhizobium sp. NZP2234 TaxID=2483402 RepID=UPI001555F17A|nr:hypothetical protein [Mesorhizobium sp. NZP2234]
MRDAELTERPGKGWSRWAEGAGEYEIERTWWQAKVLHFAKLNVTVWFDGSQMVGLEHWGFRDPKWTMRLPPDDWLPMPAGYRAAAERAWQEWQAKHQPAAPRAGGLPRAALYRPHGQGLDVPISDRRQDDGDGVLPQLGMPS